MSEEITEKQDNKFVNVKTLKSELDELAYKLRELTRSVVELSGNIGKMSGNMALMEKQLEFDDERIKNMKQAMIDNRLLPPTGSEVELKPAGVVKLCVAGQTIEKRI